MLFLQSIDKTEWPWYPERVCHFVFSSIMDEFLDRILPLKYHKTWCCCKPKTCTKCTYLVPRFLNTFWYVLVTIMWCKECQDFWRAAGRDCFIRVYCFKIYNFVSICYFDLSDISGNSVFRVLHIILDGVIALAIFPQSFDSYAPYKISVGLQWIFPA